MFGNKYLKNLIIPLFLEQLLTILVGLADTLGKGLRAEHFIQGAEEAEHKVTVFDAARANLRPCLECDVCGMSTQLKTVIDRFYSFNGALTKRKLKTALIVAAWDNGDRTMKDIKSHYETLCRYLDFQDQGQILGTGCGTVSMTKGTEFPKRAYEIGKSL